eukprot:TRINITY_DN218_c0_g1_i1.p1 TRINITY_DN218_c0_g1~~TRINITY_DN218_c0_g1_i1.p1  ORF type:complete len:151 (-),score=50.39 TRINITY_DN218_c0_g1_i1:145-597(-)
MTSSFTSITSFLFVLFCIFNVMECSVSQSLLLNELEEKETICSKACIQRIKSPQFSLESKEICIKNCLSSNCNSLIFNKNVQLEEGEIDSRDEQFKECVMAEMHSVIKAKEFQSNGASSIGSFFSNWWTISSILIVGILSALACFPGDSY